ncbi:SUMF1/EgtB/PvdO family nonheme iron enzyme, partial [Roseisolibacter sp. H3M3-2]|uniref:SUMF1/EgtB/PvdO family nonheme iron enzyme n=1 Tax=Roseisolibacter sp. H3M3-2 TaxID=3031323 RepID=UPI0023DBA70F
VVAAVAAAVVWPRWRSTATARRRASLSTVAQLAREGRYAEAYALAERAEARLPGDSALAALLDEVSDELTVTTEPAGAAVWLQRLPDDGTAARDSVRLGTTPLRARRVPRAEHRVVVHLTGHASAERVASTANLRTVSIPTAWRRIVLAIPLARAGALPADMVPVPGGPHTLAGPDLPLGLTDTLRPFLLDRFEVTNDAYRAFVRAGGYARLGAAAAGARLADRTGLPAPRDWTNQEPPAGRGDHPVTGVSWHEAAAYCASRGRRLPTLFEWEKAARDTAHSTIGIRMPWGYASAATAAAERRANFGGAGTVPVDAHPFGIGAYGAYAMGGNAKEWLATAAGAGRVATGGSWQDPAYVFARVAALDPATASPALGFRCARDSAPGAPERPVRPLPLVVPPTVYRPVDAAGFRSLLAFYRYDRRPANARGATVREAPDWRRERVWIDGPGGDSVLVYLYLPRRARPPYQTLVSVPSTAAFFFEPVWAGVERELAPHLKAGRAVLAPVLDGMLERAWTPPRPFPEPPSVGFRDLMVRHATELRMAMDWAGTRAEVDTARLAYIGLSWGAGSRVGFAAVDDRFRAVVLVGAGIDERVQPTLPEAASFNFAPYIRAPTLVLNGRQDEEHPWATRALPLWNLLREPKELVLIDGVGHHPPVEFRAPPINAFLDRVLGPVRPAETAPGGGS